MSVRDPEGAAGRQAAQDMLARARTRLAGTGDTVAASLAGIGLTVASGAGEGLGIGLSATGA